MVTEAVVFKAIVNAIKFLAQYNRFSRAANSDTAMTVLAKLDGREWYVTGTVTVKRVGFFEITGRRLTREGWNAESSLLSNGVFRIYPWQVISVHFDAKTQP